MTAGAVAVPTIVPLRAPYPGQHKTAVDTSTKIELHSDTEGVKIYYTLNGSKPEPFQKIGPAARATHAYREPFTLPSGKRTVKAVAVSEDERESFVVTKVFDVEQLASDVVVSNGDDLEFMAEIPIVQQAKREVQKFADKMVTGREAWAEIQRMKFTNGSSSAVGINGHSRSENGTNIHQPLRDHHRLIGDVNSKKRLWAGSDGLIQAADKYQDTCLRCPSCFVPRPFDLSAKFCDKCGFTLPSLHQRAAPSSHDDDELGLCWNCKSVVPLTMVKCLVCEASFTSGTCIPRTTAGVVGDLLLCTICGTSNAPNRAATCVTCCASLRTCAKLVRQDVGNPASTQMVTLKCEQCGHYNGANAVSCIRCQAKSLSPYIVCSTCTASNSVDSQFCGTCGLALIAPPASASTLRNGSALVHSAATPMLTGMPVNSHMPPLQSVLARLDPPRRDAITQTVGLVYQPQQPSVNNSKESDVKQAALSKDVPDPKQLLTAISPGRGYWRKQMEHVCGHMKAHAAVNPDFRSVVSGPRLGKVLSASVEEDGDEVTIVVTFKRHDNDKNIQRRRNNANSDTDDNESVDELRGVSRELLRTYGSGRRSNMSSASSHDGFDSDRSVNTTSRSRKTSKKHLPPKSPKKVVKKTEIVDNIKDEDRKLLKEVGKNGSGEPPEIRQLIEEGANPNCVNKDGFPVLHVAVMNKHVDAIRVLVGEGTKINAKGPNRGNTALHEAVSLGPTGGKVIDALLACGADVNAKNDKGESSYDMAVKDGQDVTVKKFASFLGQSKLDKLTKPRPARGVNDF